MEWEHSRTFGADPDQAKEARAFVASVMASWDLDADLIVTTVGELAANAILHSHSAFTVSIWQSGAGETERQVIVEVADGDTTPPSLGTAVSRLAPSGRGLVIIDALANSWGSRRALQGKVVWAQLTCPVLGPPETSALDR